MTVRRRSGSERLAERIRAAYGPAVLITSRPDKLGGPRRSKSSLRVVANGDETASRALPLRSTWLRTRCNRAEQPRTPGDPLPPGRIFRDAAPSSSNEPASCRPWSFDEGLIATWPSTAAVSRERDMNSISIRERAHTSLYSWVPLAVDGGLGSALLPGHYQVIALVMDETGKPPRYTTPAVGLTVTNS